MHRLATWAEMRRDRPALFDRSCALEDLLNDRRTVLGRDPVYLTRLNQPLRTAIGAAQATLPGLEDTDDIGGFCDNGSCFT